MQLCFCLPQAGEESSALEVIWLQRAHWACPWEFIPLPFFLYLFDSSCCMACASNLPFPSLLVAEFCIWRGQREAGCTRTACWMSILARVHNPEWLLGAYLGFSCYHNAAIGMTAWSKTTSSLQVLNKVSYRLLNWKNVICPKCNLSNSFSFFFFSSPLWVMCIDFDLSLPLSLPLFFLFW